jgi:hypothetical protein
MRTKRSDRTTCQGKPAVHPRVTGRILWSLVVTLLLFLTGCVTVDVINLSELNARVLIRLPDTPGGYTRYIRPGSSTSTFSNHGGAVTIQTLPDEQYRKLLEDLRTEINRRLFEEGESLSAEDVARLVQRLEGIDDLVEQMADDGTSCTVNAPDFSSVTAILNWDSANGKWALSCSVDTDE